MKHNKNTKQDIKRGGAPVQKGCPAPSQKGGFSLYPQNILQYPPKLF